MNVVRKDNKARFFGGIESQKQKDTKRFLTPLSMSKKRNISLFGLIGLTTVACNASQEDQCFGSLGVIIGSLCASNNDAIVNTTVKLTQISSNNDFTLSRALGSDGEQIVDTVDFINKSNVIGTKYTLTDGDILKNPGTVYLQLVNSGSIDGQKIFSADEIELDTQGTTVILASDWYNNRIITIKNSDQSVTLNNLQASKLDSAIAEDNMFYPNTSYRIENISAPSQMVSFYFNEMAILGTSTELDLIIKDSEVGVQAGVFINPNAVAAVTDGEVDPFLVEADTNIETLNLELADSKAAGSIITDLIFNGLETLAISGGTPDYKFEITNPMEASLVEIHATNVPTDLILDVSDSISKKTIQLGSGDDILSVGSSLVAVPGYDSINGGDGLDKILITLEGAIIAAPNLISFESLDLSVNGDSSLDFLRVSDLEAVNILESSSGVSLTNIPFDLTKFNISGSQTGAWSFAFEDNAASTADLNWSNNSGTNVTLTSLAFDEVQSVSITSVGAQDISLAELSVDSDDTKLINLTNIGDGNIIISPGGQLDTLDAVTSISLTSTEGGNISVGSATLNFGVSNAQKLSNLNLVASETGTVEFGSIGASTQIEDLQSISITSFGADVSIGSIVASKSGTFSAAISSSATVSLGDLNFENAGNNFVVVGSGTLGPITFINEAYSIINISDLVTDTNISFANDENGVTFLSGSGSDTIAFGLGADVVTGNNGGDVFVIGNGSSGLTLTTADIITDFQSNDDKLKLGVLGDATTDTGNYVESSSNVANYADALTAANLALASLNSSSAATELYAFEYDSNSGYLFIDTDSDGVAEDLIILTGVESSLISAFDIIA